MKQLTREAHYKLINQLSSIFWGSSQEKIRKLLSWLENQGEHPEWFLHCVGESYQDRSIHWDCYNAKTEEAVADFAINSKEMRVKSLTTQESFSIKMREAYPEIAFPLEKFKQFVLDHAHENLDSQDFPNLTESSPISKQIQGILDQSLDSDLIKSPVREDLQTEFARALFLQGSYSKGSMLTLEDVSIILTLLQENGFLAEGKLQKVQTALTFIFSSREDPEWLLILPLDFNQVRLMNIRTFEMHLLDVQFIYFGDRLDWRAIFTDLLKRSRRIIIS